MRLRNYQKPMFKGAVKAIDEGIMRSSYYASTGAGKTVVFTKLIQHLFDPKISKRILVVHPRIALSMDQQSRFVQSKGLDCPYTSFHSGSVVQSMENNGDTDFPRNTSVTSKSALKKILQDTSEYDHIVFTSYASLGKIASMDWDLIICDEAHYLMEKKGRENLKLFTSPVMFFTATPTVIEGEYSMDSEELFGINDPATNINPSDMIRAGWNVLPKVSLANISTDGSGKVENHTVTIGEVFKDQLDNLREFGCTYNHKMLVALPNTLRFHEISSKEGIKEIRTIVGEHVDLYTISGERITKNGDPHKFKNRPAIIKDLDNNKSSHCIVVHCDTLAEGIDIDTLTGVYIARGLGHAKFLQTIGRVMRPHKDDIVTKNGAQKVKAMRYRKKKFAPVHVAVVDGAVNNPEIERWMNALESAGYGAYVEEVLNLDEMNEGREPSEERPELGRASNILDIKYRRLESEFFNYLEEVA